MVGMARPLGILDLPLDVLREIFDYLRCENLYHVRSGSHYYYLAYDDEEFKVIQNARLVCRSFCELASPLLVPVLSVDISSEALARVDRITKNPQIAAGIQLVQVSLAYRPREVAQSLSLFQELQRGELDHLADSLDYHTEFMDPTTATDDDRNAIRAASVLREVAAVWNAGFTYRDEDLGPDFKQRVLRHRTLLHECHEEYRRKHEEQYRLLTDGSFSRDLVAFITRMPSLRVLFFVDHLPSADGSTSVALAPLENMHERLPSLILKPLSWNFIEGLRPTPELLPAKLLWELPVAIHDAGKRLRELALGAFPTHSSFDMLCPVSRDGTEPTWDRLRDAFGNAERVRFGHGGNLNIQSIRPEHLHSSQQAYMNNYLAALVSSRHLESVSINLYAFTLNPGRPEDEPEDKDKLCPVGSILTAVRWPNLKYLSIMYASLRQKEMEEFLDGLGNRLEHVNLFNIGLRDGGWTRSLELLREKISSRNSCLDCFVNLDCLYGGGFDLTRADNIINDSGMADSEVEDGEAEFLTSLAEKYISGAEDMANPLANLETSSEH